MESYRVGSLKTVERELVKYKLDLVGMQEVVWDTVDTESWSMLIYLAITQIPWRETQKL